MTNEKARTARAELQTWYTRGLLPKLTTAASTGVANPAAIEALDAHVRSLLDLARGQEEAA